MQWLIFLCHDACKTCRTSPETNCHENVAESIKTAILLSFHRASFRTFSLEKKKRGRHSISWLFPTTEFTLRSRYISFHRGEANSARLRLVCEIYFSGAKRKLVSRDPCCALTSVLPRTLCSLGDLGARRSGTCVTGGISIVDEAVGVTSRIVGRWADLIDM